MRPLFVIGTRPEAIKLAPVIRECEARGIDWWAYFTGQHQEEVMWLAHYFEIAKGTFVPHVSGTICQQVAQYMCGIEHEIERSGCDAVVAVGDTFSVTAAAQAAFYCKKPFVHVEAGLRTWRLNEPWPEEYHRQIISVAADLHCCPTRGAAANLDIAGERAHITGNTVIDALLWTVANEEHEAGNVIQEMRDECKQDEGLVLITAHRRENQGGGILRVCEAVSALAEKFPKVGFFWMAHPSPNVREEMAKHPKWPVNVMITSSVRYPKMCMLLKTCTFVMSDSGGLAEECPTFRKPLLILRNNTERQELVDAGGAILCGTDKDAIVREASSLLTDASHYCAMQLEKNPFGDGLASERIVSAMLERFA